MDATRRPRRKGSVIQNACSLPAGPAVFILPILIVKLFITHCDIMSRAVVTWLKEQLSASTLFGVIGVDDINAAYQNILRTELNIQRRSCQTNITK